MRGHAQYKFLQYFAAQGLAATYLSRHSRKSSFYVAYIRTVGNFWFEMRTIDFRKEHFIFDAATSQSYFQAVAFALHVNDRSPT